MYSIYTGLARLQRHNLAVKAELKVIAPKVITLVITQPPSPPTLHHTDLCVNESCDSDIAIGQFKLQPPKLIPALQFLRITLQQLSVVAMVSIIYTISTPDIPLMVMRAEAALKVETAKVSAKWSG